MKLNLHLRGIDLINIEFTAGSKGLLLDVDWFKPTGGCNHDEPVSTTAAHIERAEGPEYGEDQPSWVFGFCR